MNCKLEFRQAYQKEFLYKFTLVISSNSIHKKCNEKLKEKIPLEGIIKITEIKVKFIGIYIYLIFHFQ